jgi:hypothetical protein
VSAAVARLLGDAGLRERLGAAGRVTAQEYAWERRIDAVEGFFATMAGADDLPTATPAPRDA